MIVYSSGIYTLNTTDGKCGTGSNSIVIDGSNCIDSTSSVNNIASSLTMKTYPNPTSGDATLEMGGLSSSSNITITVYDVVGKQVLSPVAISNVSDGNKFNIASSQLSSGMYFIKISSENLNESIPLVVQHQ